MSPDAGKSMRRGTSSGAIQSATGSAAFAGYYEDTQIFVNMANAFGFEVPAGAGEAPIPGVPAGSGTPQASPVS